MNNEPVSSVSCCSLSLKDYFSNLPVSTTIYLWITDFLLAETYQEGRGWQPRGSLYQHVQDYSSKVNKLTPKTAPQRMSDFQNFRNPLSTSSRPPSIGNLGNLDRMLQFPSNLLVHSDVRGAVPLPFLKREKSNKVNFYPILKFKGKGMDRGRTRKRILILGP